MATWVIGDVQGCYDELRTLLDRIHFDPDRDRLWFAGDLVNRGPRSLETLRFIRGLDAICVLGNHDLHLLAGAASSRHRRRKDSLDAVYAAPDRDELIHWLRHRPLLHHDQDNGYTLIHAGLPPQWDLKLASDCAREMETFLRSDDYAEFFDHMYGDEPLVWRETLQGWDRLRFIANCFTRMRYCSEDGHLDFDEKGSPGTQGAGLVPWFACSQRKSRDMRILFGHWSTLGAYDGHNVHALDTGCLWGGTLTAMKLDTRPERRELRCPGARKPARRA
jgi:bis(5'-nucleosyl)-tetraphosphatase (symmetrical)